MSSLNYTPSKAVIRYNRAKWLLRTYIDYARDY